MVRKKADDQVTEDPAPEGAFTLDDPADSPQAPAEPEEQVSEEQADQERRYGEEIHVEEDAGLDERKQPQYYTKEDLDPTTPLRPGEQPAAHAANRSLDAKLNSVLKEIQSEKGAEGVTTETRTALTAIETAIEFYEQTKGTRKV